MLVRMFGYKGNHRTTDHVRGGVADVLNTWLVTWVLHFVSKGRKKWSVTQSEGREDAAARVRRSLPLANWCGWDPHQLVNWWVTRVQGGTQPSAPL